MGYRGDKQRNEVIRLEADYNYAPTGTPTITITRGQGTALDTPISAVNMTQGASTKFWYYDYTTEAAAQVGNYVAKYNATVNGEPTEGKDNWDVTVKDADDLATDILSITGGSGSESIIVSCKDTSASDIEGVRVTMYNADNTGAKVAGPFTTNSSGDTATFNLDGSVGTPVTYTARLYKSGSVSENQSIVVSGSGQHEVVLTVATISNPADPGVCRLRIFPIGLDNTDITDLVVNIKTYYDKTEISDQYIENTSSRFTYDSATDKDSYYYDAVRSTSSQTHTVEITCNEIGFDHRLVTVLDQSTLTITDDTT